MAPLVGIILLLLLGLVAVVAIAGKRIHQYELRGDSDPVTGGLNTMGFERKTRKYLLNQNPQHAVVVMQLRNYRQLTQTFGRNKSSQFLQYLYKVLKSNLSSTEPVARISGGTFCFLLKNRQESAVRARLTRIFENINQFNQKERIPYWVDLQFGVYIPTNGTEFLTGILEKLDGFLETSDQTYGFFREGKSDEAERKWQLIQQMEHSLDNGDFQVFLQPKIRLSDNRIVGAEALLRWRHPERGMLTPEMFIPVLEEYHLTTRYELYMFEQICRQMDQWKQAGMAMFPVSFDLSFETMKNPRFLDEYVRLVKQYQIAPEQIEFELSYRLQQQDLQKIGAIVDAIHDCGFHCALDKFGADRFGLHLLRELDVDTIKLDYSLLSSENNNRRNRFLVEAIIKLASQMQISIVAEGIDNSSQAQYLKQAGCDMVQGYYYFQPLSADEFRQAAYHKGELRYLEEDEKRSSDNLFVQPRNASSSIVMFSILLETDRIMFSNWFSPVLEEKTAVSGAMALFRRSELIHENDRKDFFHLMERCLKEDGWVENTIRFYTAKGRYEWLEVHMHKEFISAAGETVISGTLLNIAGWKNEVNRWKEKANRDALTGLYNREYFEAFASTSMEKGMLTAGAIIFVDIDDFKQVNDTMGHVVGDDVICWFAKRILGTFRHTDIVARYGGDEFVVFVNGIGREELNKRLSLLSEGFRFPYRNGSVEYPVSGSIGAAMFPEDGGSYLELLDRADSALYEAKRQGKNRFVLYRPGMEEAAQQ